jgi:hypothetical protein
VASFYADEKFRYAVVEELRRLGHDVLTCQEAGRAGQGIDDDTVLDDARDMRRIVLTQNRDDFKKLHRTGLPHHGIVECTYDRNTESLAQRVVEAVSQEEPGGRWLVVSAMPGKDEIAEDFTGCQRRHRLALILRPSAGPLALTPAVGLTTLQTLPDLTFGPFPHIVGLATGERASSCEERSIWGSVSIEVARAADRTNDAVGNERSASSIKAARVQSPTGSVAKWA